MNYWHMQLHPHDKGWGKEVDVLKNKSVIGLDKWKAGETQAKQFKDKMKIGDIVLIKKGATPLALVKVTGDSFESSINYNNLDWFTFKRKVKILDIVEKPISSFPSPGKTLQKAIDQKSKTYKYIDSWYKSLSAIKTNESKGFKLRNLHIKKYKILKELDINFENDNKALPIIILAGINGSGKTSILEYLIKISEELTNKDSSFVKFEMHDDKTDKTTIEVLNYENIQESIEVGANKKIEISRIKNFYKENIIFIETNSHHDIKCFKNNLVNFFKKVIWEGDKKPSEAYIEVEKFISNIFKNLNLNIKFNSLDKDENIIFKNNRDEKFFIDDISTGEKTLLSKILFLYIKNYRNKVILIDEPELSLHPSWQNKILSIYENYAKEYNCQIILATHSPHIIGSAKPEYLRILTKNKNNEILVTNDIQHSYGIEIDRVLIDIMDIDHTRTPKIAEKIANLWKFLKNEDYENNDFINLYEELEKELGSLDRDLVLARLEIAKLKAQNA